MSKQHSTQKTGRSMLHLAWIMALVLSYLFFDGAVKNKVNPNRQPTSRTTSQGIEVVLKRNSYGHYLSKGSINGIEVTVLVDTGATTIAIPENLALKMGLKKGYAIQVKTANGVTTAWLTKIDQLQIGDILLYDLKASINPGMNHSDEVLLGMAGLRYLDFAQQGDSLILKQYKN